MDRVEQVARAICAADGQDPEEPIETGERTPLGYHGSELIVVPRWHRYRDEAKRIVAAFEALTGSSGS